MSLTKRKRMKAFARQKAYDSGHDLAYKQDIAYKIFLIARENCKRNYQTVYEATLKGLMAQGRNDG